MHHRRNASVLVTTPTPNGGGAGSSNGGSGSAPTPPAPTSSSSPVSLQPGGGTASFLRRRPPMQFAAVRMGDDDEDEDIDLQIDGDESDDADLKASPRNGGGEERRRQQQQQQLQAAAKEEPPMSALALVQHWMFGSLHRPGDTLHDRQRKIVISWGLPLSLLPLAFIIYLAAEIASSDTGATGGTITAMLAMGVLLATWIPIHIYARITKEASEGVVDAWLFLTMVAALLLSIALVEFPVTQVVFFLAALVFLCDTSRKPVLIIGCLILYVLAAVTQASAGLNNKSIDNMPVLKTAYWATTMERYVYHFACLIIGVIVMSSLHMQATERNRAAMAESAAARFSRTIVRDLIRFDTDRAIAQMKQLKVQGFSEDGRYLEGAGTGHPNRRRGGGHNNNTSSSSLRGNRSKHGSPNSSLTQPPEYTLAGGEGGNNTGDSAAKYSHPASTASDDENNNNGPSARRGPAVVNEPSSATSSCSADEPAPILIPVEERLVAAFELLVNHFEQFKQHLPSWLLSQAAHQGERMVDAHTYQEASNEDSLSAIAITPTNGSTSPRGQRGSFASSGVRDSPSHAAGGSSGAAGRRVGRAADGSLKASLSPRSPLQPRLSTLSGGSDHSPQSLMHRLRHVRISIAHVDFTRATVGDPQNFGSSSDALCAFVDAVHEAADTTYGAVHSFIGDSLLATWNTARTSAQVECKAARFLAAVRDQALAFNGEAITVSGVAMTGDAYVQLAGVSGRQHALTVAFPAWRQALRQLVAFSRQVNALLLDEVTYNAASFTIEGRMVDYVHVSRGQHGFTSTRASPVHVPLVPHHRGAVSGDFSPLLLHRGGGGHGGMMMSSFMDALPIRTMPVFEILRDLNTHSSRDKNTSVVTGAGDRPEEWMYTLAKSDRASTTAMKEALILAQTGQFALARDILEAALRKDAAALGAHASRFNASTGSLPSADSTPRMPGLPRGDSNSKQRAALLAGGASSFGGGGAASLSRAAAHGSGCLAGAGTNGSGGASDPVHAASNTLPASVPPTQRRLLAKLETFAADPSASWATFPEDLTKLVV